MSNFSVIIGRIVFILASTITVVIAGGGVAFIQRPVGAAYLVLWLVWWVATTLGRQRGAPSTYDRSQRVVVFTISIVAVPALAIAPSWEYTHLSGPIPRDWLLAWIGLFIFASGIALQVSSMWALRGSFAVRLGIQPRQQLVTNGPYRVIRHPGYLSYILSLTGIGLAMSSMIALGLAILVSPFLIWRIRFEEKMLIEAFGEAYRIYTRKTKRLFPLVY